MGALDELFTAWRQNPTAESTLLLCAELGSSGHETWIRELGKAASAAHGGRTDVMLAVGRMYLHAGLLNDAQTALVLASKGTTGQPLALRYLAEVLLRRGDATRAEKVVERAMELGGSDSESLALRARASEYVALQKRSGVQAVASEIEKVLPRSAAPLSGRRVAGPVSAARAAPASPGAGTGEAPLPRFRTEDSVEVSEVYALAGGASAPMNFASGGRPARSTRALAGSRASVGGTRASRPPPAPLPPRPGAPSVEDVTDLVSDAPSFDDISTADLLEVVSSSLPSLPSFDEVTTGVSREPRESAPKSPLAAPASHDSAAPSSELVLENLVRVGVYEPAGGVKPSWEAAPQLKRRGIVPLLLGIILLSSAGGGGYAYAHKVKLERAARAATLSAEVDRLLHAGGLSALLSTDAKLSQIFDLDSRSQKAARLWLDNRVLGTLLLGDEPRGLDSAIHRGREAGLEERALAPGRVASFLVEGDLAGAAALLPKWDASAGNDAQYQLVSGAVLERAGDPRAIERYAAARSINPRLLSADVLLARLLLLEAGVDRARPVIDELTKKAPGDPRLRALEALAWALDPERSPELPSAARLMPEDAKELPLPLRAVPSMIDAVIALGKSDAALASRAIEAALEQTTGPALAVSLGFLAIDANHEPLARRAALKALSYSASYPRARTLAARVAVLGGRLDDAQRAIEDLDPNSVEVAVVRAVVAYETGATVDLAAAIKVFDGQASTPAMAALSAAPGVLSGVGYPEASTLENLSLPSIPWGELIAIDAALDTNQLELADKLLRGRGADSASVHSLRFARLFRYQNRLDAALAASERAIGNKPTVALLVERVLELIEKEQVKVARELVLRHPALLGPVAAWLGVLLDLAEKQPLKAAARLAQLEPPPDDVPAFFKVLSARALVTAKDKRARAYLIGLSKRLGKHPDLLLTARLLNGD